MTSLRALAIATRIALFGALALGFCWPLFEHLDHWGIQDWDQHLFYQEVPRRTVVDHHQLPLWNPYHGGGLPGLANPQSRTLFPSFALVLLAGTVVGVKLEIWAHYLLGLLGVYALGRKLGTSRPAAVLAAATYMLSGMLALAVAGGMTTFLCAALIPWVTLAHLEAARRLRYALLTGLGLALMFFDGGAHLVPLTFLFLALYSLVDSSREGRTVRRAAAALSLAAVSFVAASAIKLLPALELLARFPREVDAYSGYSLRGLLVAWLEPHQQVTKPLLPADHGWLTGMSWGTDENGMYVGTLAFGLFVVGLLACWRRQRPLALSFVVLLWLSLGDRVAVSLWQALRQLPLFESMRVAQRFRYCFMLCLALFAALGLDHLRRWLRGKGVSLAWRTLLVGGFLAAVLTDLVEHNRAALAEAFSLPPPPVAPPGSFRQIRRLPSYGPTGWLPGPSWDPRHAWSGLYPAVLQNLGTIDAYEPITDRFVSPVVPAGEPGYRGEIWLTADGGEVELLSWSPNRLEAAVTSSAPTRVVFNQNFAPGWVASPGAVVDHDGLLAVALPAGADRVSLGYRPRSFGIGAVITSATLLLIGGAFVGAARRRRRARRRPAADAP